MPTITFLVDNALGAALTNPPGREAPPEAQELKDLLRSFDARLGPAVPSEGGAGMFFSVHDVAPGNISDLSARLSRLAGVGSVHVKPDDELP